MGFRLKGCVLLVLPIWFACAEPESLNGPENFKELDEVCGTWVWESCSEDVTILRNAEKLEINSYGLVFKTDGTLVERRPGSGPSRL